MSDTTRSRWRRVLYGCDGGPCQWKNTNRGATKLVERHRRERANTPARQREARSDRHRPPFRNSQFQAKDRLRVSLDRSYTRPSASIDAAALYHLASNSFAGLANLLGEYRTRLDALENLLGLLTIRRSADFADGPPDIGRAAVTSASSLTKSSDLVMEGFSIAIDHSC